MSLRLYPPCVLVALAIIVPAETPCPGSAVSLATRIVQDSLIVVSIRVNDRGPYDFLVDTGAQISTVDSSLASELRLKARGTARVTGALTFSHRTLTNLESVTAGQKVVLGLVVVIQDLSDLKHADPRIRGILGDNFLERFDLLLDNQSKHLCLDDSNTLALTVRGEHIPLIEPYGSSADLPFTKPILIAARHSTLGGTPLKLRLDSGSNVAMLHGANPQVTRLVNPRAPTLRHVIGGIEQVFAILPKSDLVIGKHRFHDLSFIVPMNPLSNLATTREDGILPTSGFLSVFISPSGGYATFDAW